VYTCSVCGKGFKRVSQLKRHKRSVHARAATAEAADEPPVPDADFYGGKKGEGVAGGGGLPSIRCKCCRAVFRKPYDLKVHMRVHTGVRKIMCMIKKKLG
jgi:hypothetical protein